MITPIPIFIAKIMESRSARVSLEQQKILMDFLEQHLDIASGTARTLEGRTKSKQLWAETAKRLNACGVGCRKTTNAWARHWSDFKNRLKNHLIERKRKELGIIKKYVMPLSKTEQRALSILGPNFVKKCLGEDLFEETPRDPLPLEIKQELYHETVTLSNGYHDESESRLSGGESEHEQSIQQSDEEHGDDSEPVSDSIYPKWLVEVEKQRAEAELRRAKAEEQRAAVAARNADTALLQVQSLQKLAEAAERQADAVLRIAMALERRRPAADALSGTRELPGYQ